MTKDVGYQLMMTRETREQLRWAGEKLDRSTAWIINRAISDWLVANVPDFVVESDEAETWPRFRRPRGRPRRPETYDQGDPGMICWRKYFDGEDRVTVGQILDNITKKTGKQPVEFTDKAIERALATFGWHHVVEVQKDGAEAEI